MEKAIDLIEEIYLRKMSEYDLRNKIKELINVTYTRGGNLLQIKRLKLSFI